MRKYYYYIGAHPKGVSCNVLYTDEEGFPLLDAQKALEGIYLHKYIVTFWHEISKKEYQKFYDYMRE